MTHPSKRAVALLLLLTFSTCFLITPLAISHENCSNCAFVGTPGLCVICGAYHPDGSHDSPPPPPPPPPPTQEECDEAQEDCEKAKARAVAARDRALIVCTVATIEPTPIGELACAMALAVAGARATEAVVVCMKADDICSRVE